MSDILSEACSLTGWVSTATNTETSCHVLRRCHAGAEGGCTPTLYSSVSPLSQPRTRGIVRPGVPGVKSGYRLLVSKGDDGRDTSGAAGGKMACQETNEEQHE